MNVKNALIKTFRTVIDVDEAISEKIDLAGDKLIEYGSKVVKTVSGYQAIKDRKDAKAKKNLADEIVSETTKIAEELRAEASNVVSSFGEYRCQSLKNTIGVFLQYLKYINKYANEKEYTINGGLVFDINEVNQLESIEMNASTALETAAISGTVAAVALTGVPTVVTSTVAALATASTGTAISSLSGAAATNATLAWLGGGSLAARGGGVAAGTVVLSGITFATTGILALAAAGIIATTYFSKKNTEATRYLAEVQQWKANVDASCVIMKSIINRCEELEFVTKEMEQRTVYCLNLLEPIVYDFDTLDCYQIETMQKAMMLVKSMSELAQVPIMNNEGNLSIESGVALTKAKQILSTNI